MKIITLTSETFALNCKKMSSNLDFQLDLTVGILNGGGYVLDELLKEEVFITSILQGY